MARFALLVLLVLVVPGSAEAAWRMPIHGADVVAAFEYDQRTPFAAGQRRGVDLRSRPGAPVLAVCSGPVRHAGALPSGALGVSLGCGPIVATELGLAGVAVRAGQRVHAGALVGTSDGTLRLGARRASSPFAYIDPMRLMGAPPTTIPVAPGGNRARWRIVPAERSRSAIERVPAPAPGVPLPALLGAAALLAALIIPARRRRPDSLSTQHGLLRHYADLLRQRRAAPRARVHHDRRRRARPPSPSAWGGRLLPHRHR